MLFDMIPVFKYRRLDNGCILWLGKLNTAGRPAVSIFGEPLFRALCWEKHGPPPSSRHHAAHLCNNPKCINADHSEWQPPEVNNPRKFDSLSDEVEGVSIILKKRRSSKGNGRYMEGWCAVFRHNNKMYKSGAYYHQDGAKKWAAGKIKALRST